MALTCPIYVHDNCAFRNQIVHYFDAILNTTRLKYLDLVLSSFTNRCYNNVTDNDLLNQQRLEFKHMKYDRF